MRNTKPPVEKFSFDFRNLKFESSNPGKQTRFNLIFVFFGMGFLLSIPVITLLVANSLHADVTTTLATLSGSVGGSLFLGRFFRAKK